MSTISSTIKISRPVVGNASFSQLLAPYQQCEFIPSNVDLLPILKSAFPSASIKYSHSKSHLQVMVTVKDLLNAPVKNWHKNRPADQVRCRDIAQYIYRNGKYVDYTIYLNLNHKKNIFEIFDGIHRFEAMKHVKDCIEYLDHTTSDGLYSELSWLYDSMITLNLRISATEGEISELFLTFNKSNPVPELYMRDVKEDKRLCIEKVVDHMKTNYAGVFSSNAKPLRPNVNRDQLINVLDAVYDKMDLSKETEHRLQEAINRLNQHISFHLPTKTGKNKITDGMIQKCKATDCWLFLYSLEDLERMISSA